MPERTPFTKFTESLEYISQNVSAALAVDLMGRIQGAAAGDLDAAIEAVTDDVSTSGAGVFVTNGKARRRALRSLILCQRVYLSALYQPASLLPAVPGGWPAATVSYWKSKSQNEINAGIAMYMRRPNVVPADLQAAAQTAPIHGFGIEDRLHKVSRADNPFPIDRTCYRAVQSWLLLSGYVSLQWYARNIMPEGVVGGPVVNRGAQLLAIFGAGAATDVSDDANIPVIPAGRIVYLYKANAAGVPDLFGALGHWMVSDGGGMGFGCNNAQDAADHPNNDYARCSIPNQIRSMRPHAGNLRTFIRVYDPAAIGP